jgi:hypothetical protein
MLTVDGQLTTPALECEPFQNDVESDRQTERQNKTRTQNEKYCFPIYTSGNGNWNTNKECLDLLETLPF